jgi:hypothetical protein
MFGSPASVSAEATDDDGDAVVDGDEQAATSVPRATANAATVGIRR